VPTHIDDIAIFGGEPLFSTPRPIGQLATPDIVEYFGVLQRAYDSRSLTSSGPITQELELRLAQYHGVTHCIALANAGLGLILLMRILANGRMGEVIMPAFGYNGLPHFSQWAGQMPRFCDVDPQSHGLDPLAVDAAICDRTTSIMAVPSFHDPGAIDELCALASARDIPIFFDSVNALGASYRGRMLGSFGRAEVFSLHATKLLNGFEGGYVTTNDDALADALRQHRHAPDAQLNDVHAALALCGIRGLDGIIERNKMRFDAYVRICSDLPGLDPMLYASYPRERTAFPLVVARVGDRWPLTRDETVTVLRAEGVAIGAYYSPPLHRSSHAPRELPISDLPVAESLARAFLQLPAGELVTVEDIERLGERLTFVSTEGDAVASRLRSGAAT
jgi:dTDP-4-amino-4,6-dideoxyglucose